MSPENVSRRTLVASAAALPALAVPALAEGSFGPDHPDAELLALGRQFDRFAEQINDSWRRKSIAHDAFEKMTMPVPDSLRPKADDWCCGLSRPRSIDAGDGLYGAIDIEKLTAIDHPRAREIVQDYKRWRESKELAMEQSGYNAIEEEQDVLYPNVATQTAVSVSPNTNAATGQTLCVGVVVGTAIAVCACIKYTHVGWPLTALRAAFITVHCKCFIAVA